MGAVLAEQLLIATFMYNKTVIPSFFVLIDLVTAIRS